MAVRVNLLVWEKKKPPEAKKPAALANVGVIEEKAPRAPSPPKGARFMSEVKIPGR